MSLAYVIDGLAVNVTRESVGGNGSRSRNVNSVTLMNIVGLEVDSVGRRLLPLRRASPPASIT